MNRRTFLLALAGLGVSGWGLGAYSRYVEPRWLRTSRHPVPLSGLARPIRVLHLSDLHLSDVVPLSYIKHALDRGRTENPDLICITGDFITGHLQERAAYRAALAGLAESAPTFATLGNHDGGAWVHPRGGYPDVSQVTALLADAGITCLINAAQTVDVRGNRLRLVGVGDLWARDVHAALAFAGSGEQASDPTILLSHNPDSKQLLQAYPWHLMLCGHTHGGQLRLPIIGTPMAPVRDHDFVDGLHKWDGRYIHVTRGIGNVLGVRFNCRPEISVLELSPA